MDKIITIKELIDELKKFDENSEVFLSDPACLFVYCAKTGKPHKIERVKCY